MKSAKTPKSKKAKAKGSSKTRSRQRIISAMLDQAADEGWRAVTLITISDKTKLSLRDVCDLFPTKQSILNAFLDDIDEQIQAGTRPQDIAHSPKDRLFEVLMRRFDILQPHKKAIANILHDMPSDPLACFCSISRFRRSMAAMLEAAQLSSPGFTGVLKTKGLALVYLNTVRVWLRDDTLDMSKTMATLDKSLGRADSIAAAIFKR